MRLVLSSLVAVSLLALAACKTQEQPPAVQPAAEPAPAPTPVVRAPGVDVEKKVIRIGVLNDESGPGAGIGKPFAQGKRMLAQAVAGGELKLLPAGWTIELVERDHGYNPQQAVQHYNAIKDDILFIGHSFGTPNTLPLKPMLARDKLVAFPASNASDMAESPYTPPLATFYKLEAMRAMDWVVESAGGPAAIKAAIVYQQDDYGKDGLDGWTASAKLHGVTIVDQQAVAPGQKDYAAVVTSLQAKGATHVLLTTLPSSTAPILGTAAQLGYAPIWIGNTPAWIDRFFDPQVIPPQVFTSFYWVSGLAFWGDPSYPGMNDFLAVYEKYGKSLGPPNMYLLISYVQGVIALEAASRALAAGPLTRETFLAGLQSLENYDASGLSQPVSMKQLPYVPTRRARVIKPKMAEQTWEVIAPFAEPQGASI